MWAVVCFRRQIHLQISWAVVTRFFWNRYHWKVLSGCLSNGAGFKKIGSLLLKIFEGEHRAQLAISGPHPLGNPVVLSQVQGAEFSHSWLFALARNFSLPVTRASRCWKPSWRRITGAWTEIDVKPQKRVETVHGIRGVVGLTYMLSTERSTYSTCCYKINYFVAIFNIFF